MCYSKVTIYACKCKEREKANCHQPGPACNEKLAHEVVNMSRELCYRHSGHSDRMDLDPLPGKNASAAYNPSKGFTGGYPTNTGGDGMISPDFGPAYDLNSPVSPISLRDLPTFPVPTSTPQATLRGGLSKATKTATVVSQSNRNNGPLFAERSRTAQSPVNKAGNAKSPATDGIADPLRRRKDGQRVSKMTYRIGNAVNDLASINQPGLDLSGSRSSLGLRGRTIGPLDLPTIPDHVFQFDHPMPNSPTIARRGARKARQAAIEGNGKTKAGGGGGGDKATRAPKTETRQPIITTRETPSFPGQRPNFPLTDPMTAFKPEYYVSSFAQPTNSTATTTKTFNRPSGPPAPINTANVARPSTSHYNTRSRANTNKTSPTYAGVRKQQRSATSPLSPRTLAAATNARLRAQHQHQSQPQVRQPNTKNQKIANAKEPKLGQYRLFPQTNRVQAPTVNKSPYRGNPPPLPPPPPPPPRSNTRPMRPPQPPPRAPVYVNNNRIPPKKQNGRGGRGSGKKGTCEIM